MSLQHTPRCLRSVILSGLVLFSALQGRTCAQQDTTWTAQVIRLLQSGNIEEALSVAKRSTVAEPHSCQLWSLEGVAEQALRQAPAALTSFQHALKLCPTSLPALEGAAQIEFAANDAAAAGYLRRILMQRPNDPVSHAMLASLLAARGDCTDALTDFEASRPLFPTQPRLLHDYGICLLQTAHWRQAVQVYAQLNRQQPEESVTLQLAYAQWKAGDVQQALETLRPVLQQNTNEQAMRLGSRIAQSTGDARHAVALLRNAILLDPKNVENYLAFARLADAYQSYRVGADMLDAGLKVLPDAAPLYVARGVLRAQLGQGAAAMDDFSRAHELDPRLVSALDAVGVLEEQQHADSQSLALFRKQAFLHPDDALLQYLFAELLSEQSGTDLHEAIAAAQRASILEPGYQPALDLSATLFLRVGQLAAAISMAEKALTLDLNDTQALFVEIRAKSRLGERQAVSQLSERLHHAQQIDAAAARREGQFRLIEH